MLNVSIMDEIVCTNAQDKFLLMLLERVNSLEDQIAEMQQTNFISFQLYTDGHSDVRNKITYSIENINAFVHLEPVAWIIDSGKLNLCEFYIKPIEQCSLSMIRLIASKLELVKIDKLAFCKELPEESKVVVKKNRNGKWFRL